MKVDTTPKQWVISENKNRFLCLGKFNFADVKIVIQV